MCDYLNEGYIALLDAIYGYTNNQINFSTFAWASLKNRMIWTTNGSNPMCPLTTPDLALLVKYEKSRQSFNDRATFDQVTEAMGLTEEQRKLLSSIMTTVHAESQLDKTGMSTDNDSDYTSLGSMQENKESPTETVEVVRDAIKRAGLTEFEQLVLDTSMNEYYGWQTDLARKNINPNTNKPLSKTRIAQVLRSAQQKVRSALLRKAA